MKAPTIRQLIDEANYSTLEGIVADAFAAVAPGERLTVTEAAQKYSRVPSAGGHSRSWSLRITPYLQEPQDVLTSLNYQGMIFVGPARTGKSFMGLNWLGHTVMTDPSDMLYIHMDRENARKWSKGELDRFLNASPDIRREQLTARKDDNTFDKEFRSGMRFMLGYPTVQNLSSITVGKVWFLDYDRMTDDVGGEGTPFDLGQMRTTTFKRFGMTVAESSPNPAKEIMDPKWIPESPHQAPPIRGIFDLYNRGDRRRWYWRCPQCHEPFEPDFKLLHYPDTKDVMEAAEQVVMVCPHDGFPIEPPMKDELNERGRWVREGMLWAPDGTMVAREDYPPTRSSTASFWLKGPAAGYQNWDKLVEKYLRAVQSYADTGDEGPLRKTVTTDQGSYYIPRARLSERSPEELMDKAEFWGSEAEDPTVPEGVRFLVGTVDIQANAFVCQTQGFNDVGDMFVIDSFRITISERRDANGERLPVDPAAFQEDWDLLRERLIVRSYSLGDRSGRRMQIRAVGCDSGGREGVTFQAYDFWRRLKTEGDNLHRRFILLKGDPKPTRPRAMTTWPDSHKKDKYAVARGDVPVMLLNSDLLKDQLSGMLSRRCGDKNATETDDKASLSGMLRFPNWMPKWFYVQMTNEIRNEKGWRNPGTRRNETWDLAYYALGVVLRPVEQGVPFVHFGYDRMSFGNPPVWAEEWASNPLVFGGKGESGGLGLDPKKGGKGARRSISDLGKDLI